MVLRETEVDGWVWVRGGGEGKSQQVVVLVSSRIPSLHLVGPFPSSSSRYVVSRRQTPPFCDLLDALFQIYFIHQIFL